MFGLLAVVGTSPLWSQPTRPPGKPPPGTSSPLVSLDPTTETAQSKPAEAVVSAALVSAPTPTAPTPQALVPPTRATPPPRVGIQVGHWHIAALPPSLARLSDQTGTAAAGRTELELNLDVAQRTAALLARAGVIVDLLPATIPNAYRADAFVAIHADANFTHLTRGYKIAPPYRTAVAWIDAVLAEQLDVAYGTATGLPRDVEITDNMRGYYAVNGWMGDESRISTGTPGVVIETGFMTSAADRAVLFDQPDRVAAGVAAGIIGFLHHRTATDAVQQHAIAVAAMSPTGCSVVVLLDDVPVRSAPDPSAPAVEWVSRGAILPYLDSTARPTGPFTNEAGRVLAVQTGYYRVGLPGGGQPGYINHAPVVVQLPVR
ncbi:MAG: N-acetylmuramoyl-L-alanine amidase [Chloroflexia bacterium]